jgi:hypothetical protein
MKAYLFSIADELKAAHRGYDRIGKNNCRLGGRGVKDVVRENLTFQFHSGSTRQGMPR